MRVKKFSDCYGLPTSQIMYSYENSREERDSSKKKSFTRNNEVGKMSQ